MSALLAILPIAVLIWGHLLKRRQDRLRAELEELLGHTQPDQIEKKEPT